MTNLGDRIAGLSPEKRALLERKLAQAARTKASRKSIARDETLPPVASLVQQGFWAMEQIDADTSRLNEGFALSLKGPLDVQAMEHALSALVERHEALRARFSAGPEGDLQVAITPCWQFALPLQNLTGTASGDLHAELQAAQRTEVNRPFQLDSEHLIRAVLYRLGEDDHSLQLTFHHLVIDGWGIGIAFRDLAALYNSARTGTPVELPNLPVQFTDFAHWHREQMAGPEGERLLAYWLDNLAGSPKVLSLPTDRPRPIYQTFRGDTRTYTVPPSLMAAIQDCCLRENTTPFMVLLTAVYAVFAKYTGQNDILVGSPMAARMQIETEHMLGCFTNTVVLRGKLDGDPSFHDLLQRVRKTALDAFAHQDLPIDMLKEKLHVDRDPSRSPIVQVFVVYQNTTIDLPQFDGLLATLKPVVTNSSKLDMTIELNPVGEALEVDIEYSTDLFDGGTIDRLWSHMAAFLERGIAAPDQKVAAIPLNTAAQRQQLLVDWNQTQTDYPKDVPLAALVEAQVERTPQAVAVVCGAQQLTFSQLNQRANQLAHYLRNHGAGPDELIGVCLDRSVDLLVALLAIIKAGAAYMPIDPLLPAERVQYLFQDSAVRVLLTERSFSQQVSDFDGSMIFLEDEGWRNGPGENLDVAVGPTSLAYLIYTSGSTGKPKGVQVPRQALTNLLWSMRATLQLSEADRLLAVTTISFDIAGVDIWLPLLVGAQIVLATREDAADGNVLRGLIERHDITFMQATPVSWRLLFLAGWKQKSNLQAICTGEAMPADLAAQLLPAVKCLRNMYGPTETTIWSTGYTVTDATKPVLIGRPIANTSCYILDNQLQPVPIGITGELYIGGAGLAKGYLNRPDLTAAAFVPDPFFGGAARMYRTGDLARFGGDGNIECLGRIDHQVKIRGFRIELGEIETVLAQMPTLHECVVLAREDEAGDRRLVAYVVVEAGAIAQASEMRDWAKQRLPEYMVPAAFVVLERMPLSSNGKVDRKALPAPDAAGLKTEFGQIPQTQVEIRLASIWEEVLKVNSVQLDDDFFDLGGQSLLAVQMMTRAREAFGCELPLTLLFGSPRLGDLAKVIETEHGRQPFKPLLPIRKTGTKPPLFCVSRPNVNALGFIFLARHLSPDQPVIGLQTHMDKDGSTWVYDQSDYEEKAKEYIEVLRESYPEGPYLLTGFCEGAHIAFEMARELDRMNLPVGMIAILDAWPVENTVSRTRYILRNYWWEFRKFSWERLVAKWNELIGPLFGRHNAAPLDDPEHQSTPVDEELLRLTTEQVERRYWPGPDFVPTRYNGRLKLFRTAKQLKVMILDYKMGWGDRALGGVDVFPIAGSHQLLLREPYVKDVAAKMQLCIDEALAGQPDEDKNPTPIGNRPTGMQSGYRRSASEES